MKVVVDQERCQGYVICLSNAENVFDFDDATGKAFVILEEPTGINEAAARVAARNCPAGAITVEE